MGTIACECQGFNCGYSRGGVFAFYELQNRRFAKVEKLKQTFPYLYLGLSLNETESPWFEIIEQAAQKSTFLW